ncbi:MAG: hypothetical protein OHK0038_17540 [Flammeovirgaceae bacterium]
MASTTKVKSTACKGSITDGEFIMLILGGSNSSFSEQEIKERTIKRKKMMDWDMVLYIVFVFSNS